MENNIEDTEHSHIKANVAMIDTLLSPVQPQLLFNNPQNIQIPEEYTKNIPLISPTNLITNPIYKSQDSKTSPDFPLPSLHAARKIFKPTSPTELPPKTRIELPSSKVKFESTSANDAGNKPLSHINLESPKNKRDLKNTLFKSSSDFATHKKPLDSNSYTGGLNIDKNQKGPERLKAKSISSSSFNNEKEEEMPIPKSVITLKSIALLGASDEFNGSTDIIDYEDPNIADVDDFITDDIKYEDENIEKSADMTFNVHNMRNADDDAISGAQEFPKTDTIQLKSGENVGSEKETAGDTQYEDYKKHRKKSIGLPPILPETIISSTPMLVLKPHEKLQNTRSTLAERRSITKSASKKSAPNLRLDGKAHSLNSNFTFGAPDSNTILPARLDTQKIRLAHSQKTPEFSPLSANSSTKDSALLELGMVLFKAKYLPIWYSQWILLHNRNKLRKYYFKLFNTLKELEIIRLSDPTMDHYCKIGSLNINQKMNRYQDIIPFDRTRVILKTENHDYINASYLTSLDNQKTYIATQGPVPGFGDFWQMVWEQNSAVVIMLTKEEEKKRLKCHRYWPQNLHESKRYHKITDKNSICFKVFFAEEFEILGSQGIIRELVVKKEMVLVDGLMYEPEIRRIRVIQYLGWPDNESCDPRSLLTLIDISNEINEQSIEDVVIYSSKQDFKLGPMIVHCSAGIGRTASLCVIDSVLGMLKSKFVPDQVERIPVGDLVALSVEHFRKQRSGCVQTNAQFHLCYDAILLRIGDWFKARMKPSWEIYNPEQVKIDYQSDTPYTPKRFSWSIVKK